MAEHRIVACEECGTLFCQWVPHQLRCAAPQCKRDARNARVRKARRPETEKAPSPICRHCEKPFQRRVSNQVFCGDSCRNSWLKEDPRQLSLRRARGRRANQKTKDKPGRIEKQREYNRLYRDRVRGTDQTHDKARHRANVKAWRLAHPETYKACKKNAKARRRGVIGAYSAADITRIRKAQGDRCAYCRCPLKGRGDRDHIVPLAKGGTNFPSNIQLVCKPCNAVKRDRDPLDHARSLGRLL